MRIVIYPNNSANVLEYDLKGNFIRNIPLAYARTGGHILIDYRHETLLVVQLYFSSRTFDSGPPVWLQDLEGNAIWHTYDPIKKMGGGFSNEPQLFNRSREGMEFAFGRYIEMSDSVFYVDIQNQRVIPRFTATFDGETPRHLYYKAGTYYFVGPLIYDDGLSSVWTADSDCLVIVDTKSLRGSYCRIFNDFFFGGGVELAARVNLIHSRESFNMIVDPGDLLYRIDERLSKDDISDADRVELNNLRASISEDDNSYILHGEYK